MSIQTHAPEKTAPRAGSALAIGASNPLQIPTTAKNHKATHLRNYVRFGMIRR